MSDVRRTALATLIDATEQANGWGDADVVRHANAGGHKLTRSDVSDYRVKGMRVLVPAKLVGLAAGLRLPPYRVALAALSDAGIDVPLEVRTPEDAISHDHMLSPRTRNVLLLLIGQERT